ncbi:MAG: ABC transporter ATP-binding protein [Acidimicrobiia bacterium]
MLSCRGVTVDFGRQRILDGVDLAVERGAWLSIVGPNGAGKTTLLRWLAGLVRADGDLHLDGRPASALRRRERARLIALVPQTPVVPVGMSVGDYVLLGRTPHVRPLGREGPDDLGAVHQALEHLDLVAFAGREVASLSGGERQRVLVARALAQGAPIVLLDEPTTALDVGHQQQVLDLVDSLRAERGLTVISTMHDLTLAGQYAERLALLDRGRVAVEGTATEVLTAENLALYYGARTRVIYDGDQPVVLPFREQPGGAVRGIC